MQGHTILCSALIDHRVQGAFPVFLDTACAQIVPFRQSPQPADLCVTNADSEKPGSPVFSVDPRQVLKAKPLFQGRCYLFIEVAQIIPEVVQRRSFQGIRQKDGTFGNVFDNRARCTFAGSQFLLIVRFRQQDFGFAILQCRNFFIRFFLDLRSKIYDLFQIIIFQKPFDFPQR